MKRSKPLKRGKLSRSKRKRSKYRARVRAVPYMLAVKSLPCSATIVPGHVCGGVIEADHAGPRGLGRKAHDSTVIPLCTNGHRERTDFSGPFRDWDHLQMRSFLIGRVIQTQRRMRAVGVAIPSMTPAELAEFTRWAEIPFVSGSPIPDAVLGPGNPGSVAIRDALLRVRSSTLAEDLREVGNVDVRHPDAAPLPAARIHSEGNDHR